MSAKSARSRGPSATASANYTFRQRFRVPADAAFRWCIDFTPYDWAQSGGHGSRTVRWLSPTLVVLDDRFPTPGGGRVRKVKTVQIYPEQRYWVSTHTLGPNRLSQFRYTIVPDGKNASALVFEGREMRWGGPALSPKALRTLEAKLRAEDSGLWKRFATEMEHDLAPK